MPLCKDTLFEVTLILSLHFESKLSFNSALSERDNVNVHRAAAKIIVSKNRAARGTVGNDRFET